MDLIVVYLILFIIACQNPQINRTTFGEVFKRSIAGMIIGCAVLYFLMPTLIPRTIATSLAIVAIVNGILSNSIRKVDSPSEGYQYQKAVRNHNRRFNAHLIVAALGIAVFFGILILTGISYVLFASNLGQLANVQAYSGNATDIISIEHVRVVPQETAIWKASKTVGNLGYKVDVFDLIRIFKKLTIPCNG